MALSRAARVLLLGFLGGIAVIILEWSTLPYWHPQTRNLKRVGDWMERVQPQVDDFSSSEGLSLKLYGFTGVDGAVGVVVTSCTREQLWKTHALIHQLAPPRPVYWTVTLVSDESEARSWHPPSFLERLGPGAPTTATLEQWLGHPPSAE